MITEQELSDLVEIGHIARSRKFFREADCIFQALANVYPEKAFSQVGLGLLCLEQNKNMRACSYFEVAISRAPKEIDIAAWHGMALMCAGRVKEAEVILNKVISAITDEKTPGQKMAEDLLSLPEFSRFSSRRSAIT